MNDILVGATDLYHPSVLYPWIKSSRECGFDGRVTLLVYRCPDIELLKKVAAEYKVELYECLTDHFNRPIEHNSRSRNTVSHEIRFWHMYQLLEELKDGRYVIATDTKDVVFQSNPSEWLEQNLSLSTQWSLIAPSEGVRYKDEPWGKENLINGFGPIIYESMKNSVIANVGTIAGTFDMMKDLALNIYLMGEGLNYIPNDQSSFNVLINTSFRHDSILYSMNNNWACQCGTTSLDPTKNYSNVFMDMQPIIKDGKVYTGIKNVHQEHDLYCLLHQWDRNPELKKIIEERYK